MKLPPKAIQEFIDLYRRKYKEELTYAEAEQEATVLLTLYALSQGQNFFG
jgi:hypothetical protein